MFKKIINTLRMIWMRWREQVEQYPMNSKMIRDILKKEGDSKTYIEALDDTYYACDYKTLKEIVKLVPVKYQKFIADEHDCDNFTDEFVVLLKKVFPRLPIGRCRIIKTNGQKHQLVIAIYKTKSSYSFCYIEPQSNRVSYFKCKPYFMEI